MKKSMRKRAEDKSFEGANFLAVLALAGEMARCLNENLAKLDLKPLETPLPGLATLPGTKTGSV